MRVCVFCGSSPKIDKKFLDEAYHLGESFSNENIECIYGGGSVGPMGYLADAIIKNNGKILGVIPKFMIERGWGNPSVQMKVTETMHERKALMHTMADAMVALPGGIGTFEELLEAITWKQLGIHDKPIVILNTDHYFDPLIKMLYDANRKEFLDDKYLSLWHIVNKAEDIVPYLKEYFNN